MDASKPGTAEFTTQDVAAHNGENDLWIVVHGQSEDSPFYTAS